MYAACVCVSMWMLACSLKEGCNCRSNVRYIYAYARAYACARTCKCEHTCIRTPSYTFIFKDSIGISVHTYRCMRLFADVSVYV